VTGLLRHVGRASGLTSVLAVLARLGFPAVAAAAGLAVLVLAAACWVLADRERSDRVSRILLARRGEARCLYPPDNPSPEERELPGSASTGPQVLSGSVPPAL
jgi:hypothetical protein